MSQMNEHLRKFGSLLQRPYSKISSLVHNKDVQIEEKPKEETEKKIVEKIKEKIDRKKDDKLEKNEDGEMSIRCKQCNELIPVSKFNEDNFVCYKCHTHFKIDSKKRAEIIFDQNSITYLNEDLKSTDPLGFPKYADKLKETTEKLGINEAVVTGKATIDRSPVYFGIMDYRFIMGSMGTVVGEKIVRIFEASIKDRVPVIMFCASGGARMQEGILSLYQMARVSAIIKKHSNEGLLYISILTDPTFGGVTASFASLGDIIIAEKGANVGFTGKRIIENVTKHKLPDDFQTAEFMLKHGLADYVVDRQNMKGLLSNILKIHSKSAEQALSDMFDCQLFQDIAVSKVNNTAASDQEEVTAWTKVGLARNKQRPNFNDYISGLVDSFVELHGDRYVGDDPAIVGGIGYINGLPVTVISSAKGKDMAETMKRNFGMAHPEGYRKALRLMKQAEKFNRPVVCFVDTPGAFCGVQAEERGQGIAIAECLKEMIELNIPIVTLVVGEGGSGGALALSVSDWTYMLENSIYSIISPESCAEIIFKDHTRASEVAEYMKLTAGDLLELNIIDEIIEEPQGGAHINPSALVNSVKNKVHGKLVTLLIKNRSEVVNERFNKIMSKGRI